MIIESQKRKPIKSIIVVVVVLALVGGGIGLYFALRGGDIKGTYELIEFGGIEWRVLERQGDKALLLSEWIIDRRAYLEKEEGKEEDEERETTWEHSDIRHWLNNDFYNRFSAEDKGRIAETHVTNSDNPWFHTLGGNNTIDQVFLLSLEEMVQYFGDSGQLENRPSETTYSISDLFRYDDARVAYEAITPRWRWMRSGTPKEWWLRSPGGNQFGAAQIFAIGEIHVYGISCSKHAGIRPAMWVAL
ncbi:MAG: DUF6273 domain-containing protein [Oscillospiraceae bacterium]|nr:DUF6273 domain-containing protein [Oscillospiraceae bacterium]